MEYHYKKEVLEWLAVHGVRPEPSTRPELVHEFVNALYRYELRRLRDRLLRRDIPKAGYHDRVVEVRRKYPLLSIKLPQWLE